MNTFHIISIIFFLLALLVLVKIFFIEIKNKNEFKKMFNKVDETRKFDILKAFEMIPELIESISSFDDAKKVNQLRYKIYFEMAQTQKIKSYIIKNYKRNTL